MDSAKPNKELQVRPLVAPAANKNEFAERQCEYVSVSLRGRPMAAPTFSFGRFTSITIISSHTKTTVPPAYGGHFLYKSAFYYIIIDIL